MTGNIYEDQWDCFTREWAIYKDTVAIMPDKLQFTLWPQDLKFNFEKSTAVLVAIKRHAVISVAASVLRTGALFNKAGPT